MQSVYIVYEKIVNMYVPKPMEKLDFNESIMPSFGWENPSPFSYFSSQPKPRFDPIMPNFEMKNSENTSFQIICLCKDLETATYYRNMNSKNFIKKCHFTICFTLIFIIIKSIFNQYM